MTFPSPLLSTRHLRGAALLLTLCAAGLPAAPSQAAETEWPCIQRKVLTLTAAQMWDGPDVDALKGWQDDPEMPALIKLIVSRATPMERVTEKVEQWAQAQPEAARDEKLKLLFAGALNAINDDRAVILNGIERFQHRQRELADRIQQQGVRLSELHARAPANDTERAELTAAEDRYKWDTRFFAERQESLPVACEIPVQIEQRAFDLAREIRSLMKE
jgi:hypothetical protein